MKAIVMRQFGGPEVLRLEEVPEPRAASGEVLVRVRAAGLNPLDAETRAGRGLAGNLHGFPVILGWDLSGVIEAVGDGVSRFKVGDHVYGMPRFPEPAGTCAEFAVASEQSLAFKPLNLTHLEAASVPFNALTAHQALETMGLRAGETILVHPVSSAVGTLAVQLAKTREARVIGTGAEPGDALAHDPIGWLERHPEPVDAVLDTVGGATQVRLLGMVKAGGWLVSTAHAVPEAVRLQHPELHSQYQVVQPSGAHLEHIAGLIERDQLKPVAVRVFPFSAVAEAHALLGEPRATARVVLEI